MDPRTVYVIACPSCGNKGKKRSTGIGYIKKPELWSDGKKISCPDHDYTHLVKCRSCGYFFYADEQDAIFEIHPSDINSASWDNVPFLTLPSFEEYFEGLGTDIFEKYLRWEALHSYNDYIRSNREADITPDMQDLYVDNMKSLLYFLSEDDPEELFIVIEINRQLGKFEKCISLMSKADDSRHKRLKSIYLKEIEKKNSKLFRIY